MSNFQDFGKQHSVDMDEVIAFEWAYSGVVVLKEEPKLESVRLLLRGGIIIQIDNKESVRGVREYYERNVSEG